MTSLPKRTTNISGQSRWGMNKPIISKIFQIARTVLDANRLNKEEHAFSS